MRTKYSILDFRFNKIQQCCCSSFYSNKILFTLNNREINLLIRIHRSYKRFVNIIFNVLNIRNFCERMCTSVMRHSRCYFPTKMITNSFFLNICNKLSHHSYHLFSPDLKHSTLLIVERPSKPPTTKMASSITSTPKLLLGEFISWIGTQ